MKTHQKGFTLIELLVVIAIVAVLAVVVILTLNPAELLKQARDSNRAADMATLKSAIALYLADVSSPSIGQGTACFSSTSSIASSGAGLGCGVFSSAYSSTSTGSTSTARLNNGTGWIPVNFVAISSGAPVGNLPTDPVNDATHYYTYAASSTLTYELGAYQMESVKYRRGGSGDIVSGSGYTGVATQAYVVGTAPGLSL